MGCASLRWARWWLYIQLNTNDRIRGILLDKPGLFYRKHCHRWARLLSNPRPHSKTLDTKARTL